MTVTKLVITVALCLLVQASAQCFGPFNLTINGPPVTNVLNPIGLSDSSLPVTYYFTLPPSNSRPPDSTFLISFSGKVQLVGDFCYSVSVGDDSWSECLGVTFGGNFNSSWAVTLQNEDDTLGVATVWCGKKCMGPISYVVSVPMKSMTPQPSSRQTAFIDDTKAAPSVPGSCEITCCIKSDRTGCKEYNTCSIECPVGKAAQCRCVPNFSSTCKCM